MNLPKWTLLVLAAASLLLSCKPAPTPEPKPAPKSEANSATATNTAEVKTNAPPLDRLQWSLKARLAAYEKVGHRDPKWDEPARKAIEEFARQLAGKPNEGTNSIQRIKDWTAEAIKAGCDDPLVRYLHARFIVDWGNHSGQEIATAYSTVAEAMESSRYPHMVKFYAALRASFAVNNARTGTNVPPQVLQFRQLALNHLVPVVRDKTSPIEDVYAAAHELMVAVEGNTGQTETCYRAIEQPLFENWPDSAQANALKGKFYIKYAWLARGSGWADTVTDEGWKLFRERLDESDKAFQKAWELDPKMVEVATEMITVCLGKQKPRNEMEKWFQRAMELDPNN